MNKITTSVAGISFCLSENPELRNSFIKEGSIVTLHLEPENTHDNKAIRLEYKGQKIGYVPRKKEGLDFIVQSWCHEHIDLITATVETVWYQKDGKITFEYYDGCELAGIEVCFQIPQQTHSPNDLIITKRSFSEPDVIVDFNDTQHIYNMRCDGEYKVLKGGTTFIKRFYKPFDTDQVSRQCSRYWGVSAGEISDLWESNGKVAGDFGSAIHAALEHYINFEALGKKITDTRKAAGKDETENYAMPKHPVLKEIIQSLNKLTKKLDKKYKVKKIVAEALITDSATGWGGLVDRLAIIDVKKKIARVQDYKVNIGAEEIVAHSKPLPPFDHLPANKLTKYALQMSFYAALLEKHGWKIQGLDVFIFEDQWVHRELDLIDFSILKKKQKKKAAKKSTKKTKKTDLL